PRAASDQLESQIPCCFPDRRNFFPVRRNFFPVRRKIFPVRPRREMPPRMADSAALTAVGAAVWGGFADFPDVFPAHGYLPATCLLDERSWLSLYRSSCRFTSCHSASSPSRSV